MSRVGYLIGISGTAKSCLSRFLVNESQIVEFDCLRDKALTKVFGNSNRPCNLWEKWDKALKINDLPMIFSNFLKADLPQLSNDRPVLIEGIDLGHVGVRKAFRAALVVRKIRTEEEGVFWFDPPAKVVQAQRCKRNRCGQRNETLEDVKKHRDYYAERVDHELACCFKSADQLLRALREFLLGGDVARNGETE